MYGQAMRIRLYAGDGANGRGSLFTCYETGSKHTHKPKAIENRRTIARRLYITYVKSGGRVGLPIVYYSVLRGNCEWL